MLDPDPGERTLVCFFPATNVLVVVSLTPFVFPLFPLVVLAHGTSAYPVSNPTALPNSRLALRSNSLRRTGRGANKFVRIIVVPRYIDKLSELVEILWFPKVQRHRERERSTHLSRGNAFLNNIPASSHLQFHANSFLSCIVGSCNDHNALA